VAGRVASIREHSGGPLFLGVDRLDYTKGIPQRLLAFERVLEQRPELPRTGARLIQVAVPSREGAAGYSEVRLETERIVARINGRFGRSGYAPVEYTYGSVDPAALVALYRAADVMLVTPLRDGMNLVAKEFVASRTDEDGVLVLSEHAGAAAELRAALRVDPYDVDALAAAYGIALDMTPAERRVRMRRLRIAVRSNDVFMWADRFLNGIGPA
jgi:trehalose 6-phosphate synthase/phosphatase